MAYRLADNTFVWAQNSAADLPPDIDPKDYVHCKLLCGTDDYEFVKSGVADLSEEKRERLRRVALWLSERYRAEADSTEDPDGNISEKSDRVERLINLL